MENHPGVRVKLVSDTWKCQSKFFKPRPVLYAIRGTIEKDLEQLEYLGFT